MAAKIALVPSMAAFFLGLSVGQDKAALKDAYSKYVAANEIAALPDMSGQEGQSYSGDYDYRARGKAAKVYVR